ncbi:MAG: TonB-dependent receptor [Ferruginibacter sp.]
MKFTAFFLLVICLNASANGYGQQITINKQRAPIDKIFREIRKQTGYTFAYTKSLLQKAGTVTINVTNASIDAVLDSCFRNQPLDYKIVNRTIVVINRTNVVTEKAPDNEVVPPVEISGTLTNDKGEPLAGVSVSIAGKKGGVSTDEKGSFTITVADNAILNFSYVGYKTVTVAVKGKSNLRITLVPDVSSLNDVVVIGYGSQKKKDFTGSVASVDLNEQEKTPVLGTEQLLQGRVSGVQVSQNQSQPGAVFSIRIRGTNSINASSSPLFVIDGYAGASVGDINPSDVLSIDVLKDASATAIYGSRGANGVVIITTKRGGAAGGKIKIDAYTGIQQVGEKYKLMDAKQYGTYLNTLQTELNGLNNVNDPLPYTQAELNGFGKGTDWQDAILRNAQISNYSLGINGGDADTKTYLSFNYFDQKGIIIASDYKRGIIRYNLDQNIGKKVKIGASTQIAYSYQNMTTVNTSGGADQPSVLWDAIRFNPILPVKNAAGEYTYVNGPSGLVSPLSNPVAYLENAKGGNYNLSTFANLFASYEIMKGLSFKSSFGVNYASGGSESFVPSYLFASAGVGKASQSSGRNYNYLSENVLTYNKTINSNHVINVVAGFTYQHWYNKYFFAGANNLSTDILGVDNLAVGQPLIPSSGFSENSLASYFARANYQLMDKYLFTFTMRADGSSRFGTNDKWGYFPSGAIAWRLSQEPFIKNIKAISDLKVRVSYGITGNQEIGSYNSLSQYSNTSAALGMNPVLVPGIFPVNIANPNLKWESTASANVGVDMSLWNDRLTLTADYYDKKTSDLLLFVNLPITSGYGSILSNLGEVSNKGFEFSATTLNIDQKNVKWSTTLNFSTNKNKVLNLGPNTEIYVGGLSGALFRGSGGSSSILLPGLPIGSFYGYVFDGIWQSDDEILKSGTTQSVKPGDPIYRDQDNDHALNGNDRTVIGQALPKFIYGMTNNVTVGRVNLNVFLQGIYGNKILNENLYELENGRPDFNKLAYVGVNSWHGAGTSNTLPRVSSTLRGSLGAVSDVLEDGSFLRVKSVTLSYNIPSAGLAKIFKSASIYLTGQNLLTITKYSGYDPEVNSSTDAVDALTLGTDYNAYPNYRTFLLGVKFGF